jgi:hypothetical protein
MQAIIDPNVAEPSKADEIYFLLMDVPNRRFEKFSTENSTVCDDHKFASKVADDNVGISLIMNVNEPSKVHVTPSPIRVFRIARSFTNREFPTSKFDQSPLWDLEIR